MSILAPDSAEAPAMVDSTAEGRALAIEVKRRLSSLKAHRQNWERLWQEVRWLIRPNAEDFTGKTPNAQNRKQRIYDDFPSLALQNFVSGVASAVTSPSDRWFMYSTGDRALDTRPDAAMWLENASNVTYDSIYHPSAGFQLASNEVYADWAGFGTGVIQFLEDDEADRICFRSVPLAECYIEENDKGLVDVVIREFRMTRRAAMMKFRNKLPANFEKGGEEQDHVDIIHAVYPIDSKIKFKSVYILSKEDIVIDEGMFREFPYCVLRMTKMPNDVYGRGCGTDCLQNVRVLNEAVRLMLQSSQLQAAPPIVFENDGVLSKVNLQPWGQLMIAPGSAFPRPLEVGSKINVNQDLINNLHDAIGKAFYNDLFSSSDYGNRDRVTAEEVSTDQQNRLRKMTQIVGRLEVEFLDPLIKRVFSVLMEAGKFLRMPASLMGKKFTIEYMSPAVQAQRGMKAQNTMRFLQSIIPYLQFRPDILDSLDLDIIVQQAGFAMDVSRTAVKTAEAVAQIRQQRSQAQDAQQQSQQATAATQGVLNVAQATKAAPQLLGGQ